MFSFHQMNMAKSSKFDFTILFGEKKILERYKKINKLGLNQTLANYYWGIVALSHDSI